MRIAVINKEKCRAPEECDYICQRFCPPERSGIKTIVVGEDKKPVILEEPCIGCGICVKKCPFDAIQIINLSEELGTATHQFGINSFRLFGLPVPMKGQVVGFLGPNGIGKTTAVSILAGELVPNFNEPEPSVDKVLKKYKGTELHDYFSKPKRVSVKPQNVGLIPKAFSGPVRELAKHLTPELVKEFELGMIMDRKVNELSGGELQRLAIAAAIGKEADVYFIDEPSSYLDIRQRLRIARLIREQKKTTMVVEHDLVVLDYLSDLVYLFYGVSGVYGRVSLPHTNRAGINIYLDGYSPNENVRFREQPIKFSETQPTESRKGNELVNFSKIRKKMGGFVLTAESGSIKKGEVVGVVGPNGIGKTTFVKILAGATDSEGQLSRKVSVSYKPQYIIGQPAVVADLVAKAAAAAPDLNFDAEVIGPLNLRPFMAARVDHLSGGELQRLAIALALAPQCDLYLLDEPSAFLDVEDRLAAAKLIRRIVERRKATALVVDHDIMFIDYLSDRLLVFTGEPAVNGIARGPMEKREGMNLFLQETGVTFRRDAESHRPRTNKPGSKLDQEQRQKGEFYYG